MKFAEASSAQSRASIAWPRQPDFGLRERQRLALRDLQLQAHEIDPGHGLGDGMLDLNARVHLQEIELPALVEQELDGARADIADRRRRADRRLAHARAQAPARRPGEGDSSMIF